METDTGKSYKQGLLGLEYLAKTDAKMKTPMMALKNLLKDQPTLRKNLYLSFLDGKLFKPAGANYQIKVGSKDEKFLLSLKTALSKVDDVENTTGQITNFKSGLQLYVSGGRALRNITSEEGKALDSKTPTISQQEDGFILNLKAGKLLPLKEINHKIGFNFGEDWYHSYKQSFIAFTKEIISQSQLKNYEFYRDSDNKKLELLNQITDSEILPAAKDNWNPSDVWCVKINQKTKLQKEVNDLYNKAKNDKVSIEKLNKFIEIEFNKQNLIGVSLKQVTGTKATVSIIKKDAKYIDSVKFIGYSDIFKFNTIGTYFDVNVIMSCLKLNKLNYMFRFRPRGSSSAVTQNAEGKPPKQGPFDGAIDKKNVIQFFFPGADDIAKQDIGKSKSIDNAANVISQSNKKYMNYKKWLSKKDHKFVSLLNTDANVSEQEIRRGLLNTYYAYLIDTFEDQKELFKRFYLAAKKVNEFSSIHYKIFG